MRAFVLTIFLASLISCTTTISKELAYNSKPEPQRAYIYGRFFKIDQKNMDSAYLRLKNTSLEDMENINFEDLNDKSIKMVAVLPGIYIIDSIVAWKGRMQGKIDLPYPSFQVEANTCYYMGDIAIVIKDNTMGAMKPKNNYDQTTKRFKELYKNFENMPSKNLLE